jgi:hypothetical protein
VTPIFEAALVQRYLNKDHLYRLRQLSWQTNPPPQAMVYGHFHDFRDDVIFENARQSLAAVTANTNGLVVGDFCLQRTKVTTWGFLSGPGAPDRINDSIPWIEHTAAALTSNANEPSTVFCTLLASFLGDWNLSANNYLRSLLATPRFGLASMWTRFGSWRSDALGIGEPLGSSLVRMVNDPKNTFFCQVRDLAILGDPTLRMHVLTPPGNATATSSAGKVLLSWSASDPGTQYYVYRSPALTGPFTRLSPSPVLGTSYTDNSPNPKQKAYMIRAFNLWTVGVGSYTNLSQGAFATAP